MRALFKENNKVPATMMDDRICVNNVETASIFVTKGKCEVLRKGYIPS